MEYLALYSTKCKSCGHLDPEEPTKYMKCHSSAGNTECPATEVRFVIAGEAKRLADRVRTARANRDLKTEARILRKVSDRSAAFQQKFREWLK